MLRYEHPREAGGAQGTLPSAHSTLSPTGPPGGLRAKGAGDIWWWRLLCRAVQQRCCNSRGCSAFSAQNRACRGEHLEMQTSVLGHRCQASLLAGVQTCCPRCKDEAMGSAEGAAWSREKPQDLRLSQTHDLQGVPTSVMLFSKALSNSSETHEDL